MKRIRLKVEELPELRTEVGISGAAKRQEVGGGMCLAVAAGIAVFVGMN